MLGSPGRGVDNSLKSSHSMLGITMHGLHGREKSSLLCIYSNPQTDELYNLLPPPASSASVNVFDCVTEVGYFGQDWSLCAEAHLSDGQPLSW